MPLNIAVLLKSVPDPRRWGEVSIDPVNKRLRKEGIPRVISPLDRHALEAAAQAKEFYGGVVTVFCMGAAGARETLKESLALGGDRGIFLSDKSFVGADSLATARVLAAALKKDGPYDLIFCGAVSYYGSTGQVGPQVAQLLGIPHLTHVNKIQWKEVSIRAEMLREKGILEAEAPFPLLLTVIRELNKPRPFRLSEAVKARKKELLEWGLKELDLKEEEVGLLGSGTAMVDLLPPSPTTGAEIWEGEPEELVQKFLRKISRMGLKK